MREKSIKELKEENKTLRWAIKELHWMARRYADYRSTFTPSSFNEVTKVLLTLGVELNLKDKTLYAVDGMRDDSTGTFLSGITKEEATPGTEAAMGHRSSCSPSTDYQDENCGY